VRVPSGIRGFDEMVQGGLPIGTSVVLQGPPGQEKLRFALTFLAEGLRSGGSGLVVVSSQSPDAILSELRTLGVDLDKVVQENRLRIVDWYSQREEPVQDVEEKGIVQRASIDLTNVGVALSRAIASLGGDQPKRAVVELLSPATSVYEVGQVYAFAQSSKGKFVRFNFTALVLIEKEMHGPSDLSTLHQPFDGVIEIERVRIGDEIVRKIGVLHLKDTTPDSAFRVLEPAPEGLRIVREPTKAPKPAEAMSTLPPPKVAPPKGPPPESPRRPAEPGPPRAAPIAKPAVFETKEESPTRAYLIMQIARERLKLNPDDADALFAMAAAQATLDDARGALDGLERLATIDDRYPGLWVLKTKLHARLGEVERARESRERAERAEEWEGEELMVPCPICETPVAEGASRCPQCGATFLTDAKITDELDALGQSLIQEKVTEELGTGPIPPPERQRRPPEKPRPEPEVKPQTVAPPKKPERPPAKQGLTNGFVRERAGAVRPPGMTNGLKGRTNGLTNGLRGRTNGLTNGLKGRTNGLTNGIRGRTNGLTNGLGKTNGLTNGMGRTNGLTNGLVSLRRGLTNGLTNGNGFTNGLGSPRFHREIRLTQWKLYIIPVLVVALLTVPLFTPPEFGGGLYAIRIDGDFSDWPLTSLVSQASSAAIDANVDILRFGTYDNGDRLAFYVEVRGFALTGGGVPATYDTLRIFLDTDRDATSGYAVAGMGADRLLEVSGWGNRVNRTTYAEWDTNRLPTDWNGWIKSAAIPAATVGARLELDLSWDLLVPDKASIGVYAHFVSHAGTSDETDAILDPMGGSLLVRVVPSPPEILTGADVTLAGLDFTAYGGSVSYAGVTVTLAGTALPSSMSAIRVVDAGGATIQERIPIARDVSFTFAPRTLAAGTSESLFVRADMVGATGETLGATLEAPAGVGATPSFVTVAQAPSVRSVGYLGFLPSAHRVDGAFSDWTNVSLDPVDAGRRAGVDLRGYGFERTASTFELYLATGGRAFEGVLVPEANQAAAGGPPNPGFGDSDRDTVPDADDPMPFDFDNDGTVDAASGNDYDGDGSVDYPAGPDVYLNTTIPGTFPPGYANRPVSLYIGPSLRPAVYAEDMARVFLDADSDAATGFRINVLGADYLLEFRGRDGVVGYRALSVFAGAGPLDWTWTPVLTPASASDYARLEASFPYGSLGFSNNSLAYFEVMDWALSKDASLDPIMRVGVGSSAPAPSYSPGSIHTLDISGNQKWYFTSTSTTATSCTTNRAASTTAGSSATTTTVSTDGNTVCWFTPTGTPTPTVAGPWEVILDISKTDAVKGFLPNAQGTYNAWSIGTGCTSGNEYQCVDEDPNDGDTSYLTSSGGGGNAKAAFNLPNWASPPSPLTITNVKASVWCWSSSSPQGQLATLIKNGSNEQQGSSTNCPTSGYTEVLTNYANYPWGTPRAWTSTDVDNLEAGAVDVDSQSRTKRLSEVRIAVSYVPVYAVEIFKCQQEACSSGTSLYTSSNSASYGADVTFTTPSIAAQTLSSAQRFRFKVTLVAGGTDGGSFTISYNGAAGGSSDSRGTISIPEFEEVALPIGTVILVAVVVRYRRRQTQRAQAHEDDRGDVPRQ
jgi:KaiC/GvpD/RAD55 family RecA-like ATPase